MLKSRQERSRQRVGFSLIEVVIALSLTVLLMSAVYSAITLHLRFQTLGRARVNGSQLIRALIRKMDEDFGSVVLFVDQSDEDESEDDSTTDETSIDETTTTSADSALSIGDLESGSTPITFGVVGTAELLHLCVSRPLRDLSYDSIYTESTSSSRSNDLLTISYGLAEVDTTLLVDPRRPKYDDSRVDDDSSFPSVGFATRVMDLYSFDETQDELDSEHVIAPEISAVEFSYFDGTAWLDTWDSREGGALPLAIKVSFGFWQKPDDTNKSGYTYNGDNDVQTTEHVFSLPMAIPILE